MVIHHVKSEITYNLSIVYIFFYLFYCFLAHDINERNKRLKRHILSTDSILLPDFQTIYI